MLESETKAFDVPMHGPGIFRRLWETKNLEDDDIAALASLSWMRQHIDAHGRVECGDQLSLLSSGIVFRQRSTSAGLRRPISMVLPGDICSYEWMTGRSPPSSLVAVTPCTVMRAPKGQVIDLCEQYPNVLDAILSNLAVDTAVTEELLLSVGHRTAIERLAHFLCELEFRLRRMRLADNAQYPLHMTQADIGDYLALSAVHVNRTMQELRRRGLIRSTGTRIDLLEQDELQRIAGFSPAYLIDAR